ncbi:ERF family protein [Rhizobium laguerreae]|uniref:ERF family protein n=1 Tax=Rhizobium laguerreae TaxID=1076926 RepID=UPI0014427EEA|nr:ERF family protein [Rhizobium laguerreae]NKM69204.1 ERF family protein [Rhizobium laguerreae]
MSAVAKQEIVQHEDTRLVPANDAPMVAMIERIAMDPNIPIDRLEKMLAMKERMEDRSREMAREDRIEAARREWLSAFSAVQAEIGPIFRTNDNKHTKSKYADLADIERVVTPILTKHGFSTTSAPIHCDLAGHIRMQLTIGHSGGHEKVYEDDFPLDNTGSGGTVNKTAIQAKGSTQTYARRYLKASALDLAFFDDKDGNAPPAKTDEPITEAQVSVIRDLVAKAELEIDQFCNHWRVEAIPDIPSSKFTDVVGSLRRRIAVIADRAKEKANG